MASGIHVGFIGAAALVVLAGTAAGQAVGAGHALREAYEEGADLPPGSVTLQRGDTLERLAERRYGHRYYSELIALHNGIADPARLRPGMSVALPALLDLLSREKLTSVAGPEVDLILCARARFREVVGRLPTGGERRARRDGRPFEIPPEVKGAIEHAMQDLAAARGGFGTARPGVAALPRQLRRQLQSAADRLSRIAGGLLDSESYDVDLVEQHIALALTYGVHWARAGFR